MKTTIAVLGVLFFAAAITTPQLASASEEMEAKVTMKAGSTVHLYHSEKSDVTNTVCKQDLIPLYRETVIGYRSPKVSEQTRGHREVGKIKMISHIGNRYCEAEIVEGDVRVGDIAKKEGADCLVGSVDGTKPSV